MPRPRRVVPPRAVRTTALGTLHNRRASCQATAGDCGTGPRTLDADAHWVILPDRQKLENAILKPENIRNIALVGHGGAGKTSLAEACLHVTGVTNRLGNIADGSCALDFTDEEKEKQCSLTSASCTVNHGDVEVNIVDTPGSPDFCGHAVPALAAVETAVVVVSATAGVEVNTRKMYERAREYGVGVIFVVNKIDAENVNLPEIVQQLQESFGSACLPVNLPTDGAKGVIPLLGGSGTPDFSDLEAAHTAVVEAVVGADDDLMERYFAGDVSDDEVRQYTSLAVAKGELTPIVFTGSRTEVGITEFLQVVVSYGLTPLNGKKRVLVRDGDSDEIEPTGEGDFVGLVFKVASDERTHIKYSYIRILRGTLRPDSAIQTVAERKGLRPGQLHRMIGGDHVELEEASAGEIIALAKLDLKVGDTVFTGAGGQVEMPKLPSPMFAVAIEPKARGDEEKISAALKRQMEEDPCFLMEYSTSTRETVIRGTGDLHLRTLLNRLARHYKIDVETRPPKIPYRETITGHARDVEYTHKKQTGGAGQYGKVVINLHPLERGAGYEFVDKIFGGAIDQSFRPSVDKGIKAQMAEGVLAGFPVVDVQVELIDGKTHPVDSKDIAFQIAGRGVFKEAFMKAKPILLEPIVSVEVTAPVDNLGDLQGDLASRRGRVEGQDMLPGQMAVLRALVPLAEMADYNSRLSSISGGQGSYIMELSHYDPVPANIQQRIVEESRKPASQAN